ncbi:hypothetical protein [Micromonospora sp. WMMD1274]|uniref:hypothetical protein n=1 Tax=Micromonospora sp. WMMD1274 TaxID=3404116 RepID=UPI003B94BD42
MDPIIIGAGASVITGIIGFVTARLSAKDQKEVPRLTAEAAAFTLAKDQYLAMIREVREQYASMINELEEHIAWLKRELADRVKENTELRQRIATLEEAVAHYKSQLDSAVEALKNQSVVMVDQIDKTA